MFACRNSSQHQFFRDTVTTNELYHYIDAGIIYELLRITDYFDTCAHNFLRAFNI